MPTRTISIGDEAYRRLSRMRRSGESFTDVILRLSGRGDLTRFAGAISPEFAEELRAASRSFRERIDREMKERRR